MLYRSITFHDLPCVQGPYPMFSGTIRDYPPEVTRDFRGFPSHVWYRRPDMWHEDGAFGWGRAEPCPPAGTKLSCLAMLGIAPSFTGSKTWMMVSYVFFFCFFSPVKCCQEFLAGLNMFDICSTCIYSVVVVCPIPFGMMMMMMTMMMMMMMVMVMVMVMVISTRVRGDGSHQPAVVCVNFACVCWWSYCRFCMILSCWSNVFTSW